MSYFGDGEKTDAKAPEKNLEQEIQEIVESKENVSSEVIESSRFDHLYIKNLDSVTKEVREEMREKALNPSAIQDSDSAIVHLDGEPHLIVNNKYVKYDKAIIILQTKKVVREYIKLQQLIKKYESSNKNNAS